MNIIEMIIDFIKSWFYYPKMIRYFEKTSWGKQYVKGFTRFKYSLWHSLVGKLDEK